MIKKSFFVACLSFVAVASFSQVKIKDVRTNPDLYFLRADEVASSLNLLPAPPQPGSILFMNDEAQYKWGKLQRDTPRGDQAAADVEKSEYAVTANDLKNKSDIPILLFLACTGYQ